MPGPIESDSVTGQQSAALNSRTSAFRAGWNVEGGLRSGPEAEPGTWLTRLRNERVSPKWDRFSWLTVRALFESVNDQLAKRQRDIVNTRRLRWVAHQRVAGVNDFPPERGGRVRPGLLVDHTDKNGPLAFLLVGDTGEQDASQYCVAPLLTGRPATSGPNGESRQTEFTVIVSDVIYPAGDVNEYINGFYIPYRHYAPPIYAIPGNHDWYDGLNGFMFHFCGSDPLPVETFRLTNVQPGVRLASWLWRGGEPPDRPLLSRWRDSRRAPGLDAAPVQPAPYFALETEDLLLVGIDTGITGEIDDEQGRWLLGVSQIPKQKILITGKPIYVDGVYHPGEIAWRSSPPRADSDPDAPRIKTVDDVVRYERFGYIAAIGGDVHNYQRYPVWHKQQGRRIHYLVSGGGGAYLSPTHRIPVIGGRPEEKDQFPWPGHEVEMPSEQAPQDEHAFRCYPRRGDSLAYGARRAGPRLYKLILVAAAAFCASAWLFSHGLPRPPGLPDPGQVKESARLGPLAVYGLPAAVIFFFLTFVGLWRTIESRYQELRVQAEAQEAELPATQAAANADAPGQIHLNLLGLARRAIFLLLPLAIVIGTYLVDRLLREGVLGDGQFWIAVGISLLVPIIVIAAILLGHDLRGSVGTTLPDLSVVGAFGAAGFVQFGVPLIGNIPPWFSGVLSALVAGGVGLILVGVLRTLGALPDRPTDSSSPEEPPPLPTGPPAEEPKLPTARLAGFAFFRLLTFLAPVSLATVLAFEFDSDWVKGLAVALVAPVLISRLGLTEPPGAAERLPGWLRQLEFLSHLGAVLAWVVVVLLLLSEIGDGWIATGIVAATTCLVIALWLVILRAISMLTSLARVDFALLAAVGVIAAAFLAPRGILAGSFAVFLALVIWSVGPLRSGQLNAKRAGAFMADRLGLDPSDRDGTELPEGREAGLAKLLYPFEHGDLRRGTGRLVDGAAKFFSEFSDADEPPFFKNFLRVDLDHRSTGEFDRVLTIRCFGVTGFAAEEADPPVEDNIEIPFRSRERWAQTLTSGSYD